MAIIDDNKSYSRELVRLQNYNLTAVGFQQLNVGASAASLTIPTDATYAIVQLESSISTPSIRYLLLGNKILPTSSFGLIRSNLDTIDISGTQNLINFRVIQITAGTHNLNILYFK